MTPAGLTFYMRVSLIFDPAAATDEESVQGFYRMLEAAGQTEPAAPALLDVGYGEPFDRTPFEPEGDYEPAASPEAGPAAAIQELTRRARAAGLAADDLDELVHDTCSQVAAGINNDGIEAQIGYLVGTYGARRARELVEGPLAARHEPPGSK
jgi:hypothetical protein